MDITRNHYFLVGLVLIAVGLQFRWVDSFVLSKELSTILAERAGASTAAIGTSPIPLFGTAVPLSAGRTWRPPEWLGGALLCAGAIFTFHALALSKPAG